MDSGLGGVEMDSLAHGDRGRSRHPWGCLQSSQGLPPLPAAHRGALRRATLIHVALPSGYIGLAPAGQMKSFLWEFGTGTEKDRHSLEQVNLEAMGSMSPGASWSGCHGEER